MLFNSFEFLIFLPIVFAIYWIINKRFNLQNLFILIVSYVFYGWWDWRFLILIFFSSLVDFTIGQLLEKKSQSETRKLLLGISLFVNLGTLGVFKYFNFFSESFTDVLNFFGFQENPYSLSIILPVGISFYTFQTLSYTIDVYRKQIQPVKDPIAFFAYVSFFPQLVAGPIERAKNLIPQFLNTRVFNHALASEGLRQILWGLFKKVIVADNCAVLVDYIFNDYQNQNSIVLVLGAVFFAFQIYGDFSGYSDMAIGISKLLGIRLMRNFNYPYFASNISEFWKRWHISLTTWFKDYLYIPLGGSRTSLTKQVRNVFIIFLVSGFWHGANWTFIFWGLLNAFFFLPFIFIKSPDFFRGSWKLFGKVIGIGFTFACVTLGWIFFRSESLAGAFNYINGILSFDFVAVSEYFLFPIPFIILMLVIELFNRKNEFGFQRMPSKQWQRWPIYLGMIVIILAFLPQSKQSFIYFQF